MKLTKIGILIILIFTIRDSYQIIGFDCGADHVNITGFSLLDVGQCNIPKLNPNVTETYVQLVQVAEYSSAEVYQCKVEVHRTITHCGWFDKNYAVEDGKLDYIREVTADECGKLHQRGEIFFSDQFIFRDAKVNQTVIKSGLLAGSLDSSGNCKAVETFTDGNRKWEDVFVEVTVKVTLTAYTAPVKLENNQVLLKSGIACELSKGVCVDMNDGYSFWNTVPTHKCDFANYDVLYQGYASKVFDKSYERAKEIYTVKGDDVIFAVTKDNELHVCGHVLVETDHPKIYIIETAPDRPVVQRKKINFRNINLFSYINAKFVFTETHIRTQMDRLYQSVLEQRCQLEQRVLKNTLLFATIAPADFAKELMSEPGYTARVMGEVVYLIKCQPVEVTLNRLKECYQQIPVLRGNDTYFLSPRTHILMKMGTQVDCHPLLPPMHYINNNWFTFNPRMTVTSPPELVKPLTRSTWNYISAGNLATSGIYSEDEIKGLRDHIMFPIEQPAVLNTITRGMSGQSFVQQGLSLSNILDEVSLRKIIDSTWKRVWGTFTTFGTASAGFIGVYFLIRLTKAIIDTMLRFYQLHDVFGWSFHLIGSFWDSVTSLILHMATANSEEFRRKAKQNAKRRSDSLPTHLPNSTAALSIAAPSLESVVNQPHAPAPAPRDIQPQTIAYTTRPNSLYPEIQIINPQTMLSTTQYLPANPSNEMVNQIPDHLRQNENANESTFRFPIENSKK